MQNTAVLRRTVSSEPKTETADQQRPKLFQPQTPVPVLNNLFNLKRRPGYYNSDARVALLRRTKGRPHDELLVDFSGENVHVALSANGLPLACGDWGWKATVAGQLLSPAGPWCEESWLSTKAHDYLEIVLPLSGGWKIERHALLARDDRFLLLADALRKPDGEPQDLRYSFSLPLAAEAKFEAAKETREGWLTLGGRRRATVVAPGLPEWRSEFSHAELAASDGRLTVEQATHGRNLYAALWIDLHPRRLGQTVTWRRLTVGENVAPVPRDVAAAYRIQAGRDQWLFYRSLADRGNRSVLGHNSINWFDCLRIEEGGVLKEIVAVD